MSVRDMYMDWPPFSSSGVRYDEGGTHNACRAYITAVHSTVRKLSGVGV